MNKGLICAICVSLTSVACSWEKVPAGYKGIKVYLLGGDKGVDHEELGVGRYVIGLNEELFLFPVFKQNYTWTQSSTEGSESDESFTFQTKEGMTVNADVGITYSINQDKVSDVFQAYRRRIDEITDTFLRNHVRDAFNSVVSTMEIESVYGVGKADMVKKVESMVRDAVKNIGIDVEKIYLVGQLRLPQSVTKALNAKIEATQRAQQRENELREAEAEAKKKVAEAQGMAESNIASARGEAEAVLLKADAQAKANKVLSNSLTEKLIEYEKIKKWDGKLPQFTGNGPVPMMNIVK